MTSRAANKTATLQQL